jgi:hypothetical protein
MRALKEWGKSNPHIQRDTPLGIRVVGGKLRVVKKRKKKSIDPGVTVGSMIVEKPRKVSADMSTAEIAKARRDVKSDF